MPRDASEEGKISLNKKESNHVVNDFISDNASVLNQPMRDADKEDYNMTMQQANPMRESLGNNQVR